MNSDKLEFIDKHDITKIAVGGIYNRTSSNF